jgi:pimeloyl-ACP methyl ester carboxylesterase
MVEYEERHFLTPDGLRLVADVGGPHDAPTVILAHGGGQTRHSWRNAMQSLVSRGYHTINYDARGHGDSDWALDGQYSLDIYARDLASIVETVARPVALVGASMGGMAAFLAIGGSREPIADSLVLVDIVLQPAMAGVQHIWRFMNAHQDGFATLDEAADAVAAYNPDRPRPRNVSGLMKNLRRRDDGRLYWHWDPRLLVADPTVEPPKATQKMVEAAPHVTLPVLLVRGQQSDIATDEAVKQMQALVPHMECCDVANAGHMVVGDRNDAFNQGILAFLEKTLPRRG